jgi:predicted RNA-binding Zn-ribbon protein involved in translation (DUF1610 family)
MMLLSRQQQKNGMYEVNMKVTNGNGYQVEYCAACGHTHKTYFREPTEEELNDDVFHYSPAPFISTQMTIKLSDGDFFRQPTTVYVCPRCGVFHMMAPLAG